MAVELGPFLKLVEEITKHLGRRSENRRRMLKEIAEPLFHQMEPLVDDYLALFRVSLQQVEASTMHELPNAVAAIREHREKLWRARVEVVGMADAMQAEVKDKKVADFGQAVATFFYSSRHETRRRMSKGGVLVELCDYVLSDTMEKSDLIEHIHRTQREIEASWTRIAYSYGALRGRCI